MRITLNQIASHIMNCSFCATDPFIIEIDNNVEEIYSLADSKTAESAILSTINSVIHAIANGNHIH